MSIAFNAQMLEGYRVKARALVEAAAKPSSPAPKHGITGTTDETKQSVPAKVVNALTSAIKDIESNEDAVASVAVDTLTRLKDLLSTGTVESFKLAQILLSALQSPIALKVPEEVRQYVLSGGQDASDVTVDVK